MTTGGTTYTYTYNGLGERVSQTVGEVTTTYTLDLNAGLTQVLADGKNTYLYGYERIAQFNASETGYFLGDALNSVRQMTDEDGVVTLTRQYEPYGEVLNSTGSGESMYGFDGEQTDATGLQYLRARYYASGVGRFISHDLWGGDSKIPMSYNSWLFVYANPIILTDPNGNIPSGRTNSINLDNYDVTKKPEGINFIGRDLPRIHTYSFVSKYNFFDNSDNFDAQAIRLQNDPFNIKEVIHLNY